MRVPLVFAQRNEIRNKYPNGVGQLSFAEEVKFEFRIYLLRGELFLQLGTKKNLQHVPTLPFVTWHFFVLFRQRPARIHARKLLHAPRPKIEFLTKPFANLLEEQLQ